MEFCSENWQTQDLRTRFFRELFVLEYPSSQFLGFSRGGFPSLLFLGMTGDWDWMHCRVQRSSDVPPSWQPILHNRSCRNLFSQVTYFQWVLNFVTLATTLSLKHDGGVLPLARVTAALTLILCEEGYKSPKYIANLEFRGISTKCRKLKATTRNNGVNKVEPQEMMSVSPNYCAINHHPW